jgi:hypothetical protein
MQLTGEKNKTFQLLVVEEIIERPNTPSFTIGVRGQIWIITENENIEQTFIYTLLY